MKYITIRKTPRVKPQKFPKDKEYTISGNNQDGFIVTVKISETELPTETEETEETKEIESTDTETETNS